MPLKCVFLPRKMQLLSFLVLCMHDAVVAGAVVAGAVVAGAVVAIAVVAGAVVA